MICRLLWSGTLLAVAAAAAPTPGPAEPRVTLPVGLDLESVVPQLQRGPIRVVVADPSPAPADLSRRLDNVPLKEALQRISLDFDRRWLRRGACLALQHRFNEPDAGPGVELEEARIAAADMYGLIRPFSPRLGGLEYTLAKARLVAALTPELQQRMIGTGIPLTEMPRDLQRAWLEINSSHAYASSVRELRRAAGCLGKWSQVVARPLGQIINGRPAQLDMVYPDPQGDDGRVDGVDPGNPIANLRGYTPVAEGFELHPADKAPRSLQAPWPVAARRFRLREIAGVLKAEGGPRLTTPAYAGDREVLIASLGSRFEVLTALADLWGWELRPEGEGFALGRPRFAAARSAVELHARLMQAVPPPIWHNMIAIRRHTRSRWGRQMALVLDDVERVHGKSWKSFRPTDLTPEAQQRLANVVFMRQVSHWWSSAGPRDRPPPWIVTPERGVLRLGGPLGPGLHPMLRFEVTDDNGQTWMWGWAVGTAKIGR
jgi:hypothetical protein